MAISLCAAASSGTVGEAGVVVDAVLPPPGKDEADRIERKRGLDLSDKTVQGICYAHPGRWNRVPEEAATRRLCRSATLAARSERSRWT